MSSFCVEEQKGLGYHLDGLRVGTTDLRRRCQYGPV